MSELSNRALGFIFFCVSLPIWIILYVPVKVTSAGPFLFTQKRMGKGRKIFTMYKIRTMVEGAEELKRKCVHLNEADGPVFKIKDDPRYTRVGKFISRTGLDELPQLINVVKGEMALVGPRPLPVEEALKVPQKHKQRFSVLPGITSPWVVRGAHALGFKRWMELDIAYIRKKSVIYDMYILLLTILLMGKLVFMRPVTKD